MSITCTSCHADNDDRRQFCYRCGNALEQIHRRQRPRFRKLSLNSFAGFNLRGINFFPLGTAEFNKSTVVCIDQRSDAPIVYLEDKSWYCPFCGKHNGPYKPICTVCGREA